MTGSRAGSRPVAPAKNAATWTIQAVTARCPARAASRVGQPHTRS
jgi:hypothetical protein